ncbi:hypothetical protein MnTg02_00634 [bacterium MnTg02]|nr:hypothetical protein MnTg02_00634 [bacterium MnTg02]
MKSVEKGRSEKRRSEQQQQLVLLTVIAHKRHQADDHGHGRGQHLKTGMKAGAALPIVKTKDPIRYRQQHRKHDASDDLARLDCVAMATFAAGYACNLPHYPRPPYSY